MDKSILVKYFSLFIIANINNPEYAKTKVLFKKFLIKEKVYILYRYFVTINFFLIYSAIYSRRGSYF